MIGASQTNLFIIHAPPVWFRSVPPSQLPARTRSFAYGETLLQAGADHEVGFVILSGLVELRRDTGKLVENAEQGTVIGAVSLLFRGARELNAIAKGPVEAATIDRATVSAQLPRNPELAREFTSMLLGRLKLKPQAELDTVPVSHDGPIATPGSWSELRLKPGTSTTRSELPKRGLTITEYPFVVGRKPLRGEHAPRSHVALMFPDVKPYNLSRNRFAIEKGHTAPEQPVAAT